MKPSLSEDPDSNVSVPDVENHFAKFNIKLSGPEYTEEEYDTYLKNDDWSKDETDYLVTLAMDFDLRWIVITDRYEYHPKASSPTDNDAMAITTTLKLRTMEDLKARYYDVAAKIMVLRNPLSSMSASEFDLYEKMTKFDPVQESTRKTLVSNLLTRTAEHVKEEEVLLIELKRIMANEERLSQERKELYARLEAPLSTGNTTNYQSSQSLTQLMQTLVAADKSKKRRSLVGAQDGTSSPAGPSNSLVNPLDRSQRNSIAGPSSAKRLSTALGFNQRQLSTREEAKYGVSHHDRLTAGVSFRTSREIKVKAGRSGNQSVRITAALTELGLPGSLVMPTSKTLEVFEKLVSSIQTLLDIRKVSEKTEGELKVLKAQRDERERRERGEEARADDSDAMDGAEEDEGRNESVVVEDADDATIPKKEDDDDDGDGDGDGEDEDEDDDDDEGNDGGDDEEEDVEVEDGGDEDANGGIDEDVSVEGEGDADGDESRASVVPSGHIKRSASVLSGASQKSTKRQKR